MVQEHAIVPNEGVLSCMWDDLVCKGEVSDAVALFPLPFLTWQRRSSG